MRRDTFYALAGLTLCAWIFMSYVLFILRPAHTDQGRRFYRFSGSDFGSTENSSSIKILSDRIAELESRVQDQIRENSVLLAKLQDLAKSGVTVNPEEEEVTTTANKAVIIPILMFACNRVTISKALDLLLKYRPDKDKFPIIVSQDCGHAPTREVIEGYGDQIIYIQQPDQRSIPVPRKERKFQGYFKIARHYGWALNQTFNVLNYDRVVIVEDDLEVAPDFYEYFRATLPILEADPTLWCVSAWNDNGKAKLIDENAPEKLYRTDFFGGLGWMITRQIWTQELSTKWAKSYWDDWMRQPSQRKGRACIRPEISRTKTFGKVGVSNGLFFDKHLKYITLSSKFVQFTKMDLRGLMKDPYDRTMAAEVNRAPVVSLDDLKRGAVTKTGPVRLIYHTKESFKRIAKVIGIMDDFKSGVPRMAYKGVVSTMYNGLRVYVAPNLNWKGYDPSW